MTNLAGEAFGMATVEEHGLRRACSCADSKDSPPLTEWASFHPPAKGILTPVFGLPDDIAIEGPFTFGYTVILQGQTL